METKQDCFVGWIRSHGGYLHPDLDLFAPLPGGDRGVVTRAAIKEGEQLVRVPLDICLHMPTDAEWASSQEGEDPSGDQAIVFLRSLPEPLPPFFSTVLLLLHHQAKGQASKYEPLISILPAHHDCTLAWDTSDSAYLKGTSIEGSGLAEITEEYESKVTPVISQRPDLWPQSASTLEAFVHAAGMVQSRSFHLQQENWVTGQSIEGEELYLIPGIDMINHSSCAAKRNTALEKSNETEQVDTAQSAPLQRRYFVMTAGRDVAKGEQILHSYGNLSTAELLQTYGFTEDPALCRNPNDKALKLPASDLQKAIQLLRRHHQRAGPSGASNTNIGDVEARLLDARPEPNDLFKLALYYVEGDHSRAEVTILLAMVDKRLDILEHGGPAKGTPQDGLTERQRMAAVVRRAEAGALNSLKNMIFGLMMSEPAWADDAGIGEEDHVSEDEDDISDEMEEAGSFVEGEEEDELEDVASSDDSQESDGEALVAGHVRGTDAAAAAAAATVPSPADTRSLNGSSARVRTAEEAGAMSSQSRHKKQKVMDDAEGKACSSSGEDEGTCIKRRAHHDRISHRVQMLNTYLGTPLQGSNDNLQKMHQPRRELQAAPEATCMRQHAPSSAEDDRGVFDSPAAVVPDALLLSSSVLPSSTAKRACSTGMFQVGSADPVRKRLKFEEM